MGAWNYGIFDNDSALDFLDGFDDIDDLPDFFEKIFSQNYNNVDYLEHDDAVEIIVCSAIIDRILNKNKYEILDNNYKGIIKKMNKHDFSGFKEYIIRSLNLVLSEKSELNDLWKESSDYGLWKKTIETMISHF